MSNDPIIQPSAGSASPAAGSVVPASISQTPATFEFPQDIKVDRNIVGITGVTLKIIPGVDGAHPIQVCQADGTAFISFDTSSLRLGIGTANPSKPLDVNGDAKVAGTLSVETILKLPNLTQAIIDTLTPALGWTVINTDNSNLPQFWNGVTWKVFTVS